MKARVIVCVLAVLLFSSEASADPIMEQIHAEMLLGGSLEQDLTYSPIYPGGFRFWQDMRSTSRMPFLVEVNRFPYQYPTQKQIETADQLYERALDTVIKNQWYIWEKANEHGYVYLEQFDPVHIPHEGYLEDKEVFNPEKPEFMMFYPGPQGPVLIGIMFFTDRHLSHGPQLGGPLTVWHFHPQPGTCWKDNFAVMMADDGKCEAGDFSYRSPEMIHIWFVDHPEGRFGTEMGFALTAEELFEINNFYKAEYQKRFAPKE